MTTRALKTLALLIVSTQALAGPPQWTWDAGKQTNNGSITIKSVSGGTTYAGTQNPTGAVAKTNQNAATQPPTVIVQATASLPIKVAGDPCTATTSGTVPSQTADEGTAVTADRSSLLSCQSGSWNTVAGSVAKFCGVGLTVGEVPIYCGTAGQTVYASSSSMAVAIGKFAGGTLIVAAADQGVSAWDYYPVVAGATSNSDGASNTFIIASGSRAAQRCTALGTGWFLPAINQLQLLYNNRAAIGGFNTNTYWSSTEAYSTGSWDLTFLNGALNVDFKYSGYDVRCVRNF